MYLYTHIFICMYICTHIYIYIYIYTHRRGLPAPLLRRVNVQRLDLGRGDDTVGNPHRAQMSEFEFFELVPLLELDKVVSIEQFEAAVSQSTAPFPPPMTRYSHVLDHDSIRGTPGGRSLGYLHIL